MQEPGIFIAIESLRGASEQLVQLKDRLKKLGYEVAVYTFPRYKKPASFFVEQSVKGRYGPTDAYTTSLFYSLDRFDAAHNISQDLRVGKIVLTTGYTGSTMAMQGTLFSHPEQRRGFFIWLDNLESQMLKIPRPHISFVVKHRTESRTESEAEVYEDLCQLFPRDFQAIDTVRGGEEITSGSINKLIWEKIEPRLTPLKTKEAVVAVAAPATQAEIDVSLSYIGLHELRTVIQPNRITHDVLTEKPIFYTPAAFNDATKHLYQKEVDALCSNYQKILSTLREQNADTSLAQLVLPLATIRKSFVKPDVADTQSGKELSAELQTLGSTLRLSPNKSHQPFSIPKPLLPKHHSHNFEPIVLRTIEPRNELDIVGDILFTHSDLSYDEIKAHAYNMSYEKRQKLLIDYLTSNGTFTHVSYTVDALLSFHLLLELEEKLNRPVVSQNITPRFGYAMPEVIDKAGLSDLYEECFDSSLALHSKLEAAGYKREAHYAVLLGHKVRCSVTLSLSDIKALLSNSGSPEYQDICRSLKEKISEVHPLISTTLP